VNTIIEYSEEEIMQKLKHEAADLDNLSISLLQKIEANMYYSAKLPKIGTSVLAWGLKKC